MENNSKPEKHGDCNKCDLYFSCKGMCPEREKRIESYQYIPIKHETHNNNNCINN